MVRSVKFKQHDTKDCGAACLASIAAFYEFTVPITKIRQLSSTDRQGTSVLGICHAAERIGLNTKAVKISNNDEIEKIKTLSKIPLPAIAHTINVNNTSHFVVIYKVKKGRISIMDPAYGSIDTILLDQFLAKWTGVLILCERGNNPIIEQGVKSATLRLIEFLHPHKSVIIQSIFGALVYTILGLTTSIYVQKIVDFIIPNENSNLLNMLSVIMLLLLFLSLYVNFTKSIFMLKTGLQIDLRLIMGYYKHLLRLPQRFFDNMRSGEIISRINDAVKIRIFINETLVGLTVNIFTIICAFLLMFTYYWKLAIVILTIIPIYSIIFISYNKFNKNIQRKLMEDAAELESQLVESINTIGTIKRFNLSEYANLVTESKFVRFVKTSYKSYVNGLIANTSSDAVSKVFTIVLLWVGTFYVLKNYITAGELLSFYTLIGFFMGPAASIIEINKYYQDARIATDRLFEIMDIEEENEEDDGNKITLHRGNYQPDISINNIWFRYGTTSKYVFQDFSVGIKSGNITAIVGESGSGKSTIAALLQLLYPIENGSITIGGIDIKHVNKDCLKQIISIVPQRIDLFEGSILHNIILDDYNVDYDKLVKISKQVDILGFIEKLPRGFSTTIGENGVQLSGGQRQRIAIARALYRNPDILILDEATSSLDSTSEKYIKDVVFQLKKEGKTIIIIAHRLGTVMDADIIYVLKEGELVEQGKHQGLLAAKGDYYKFWVTQNGISI